MALDLSGTGFVPGSGIVVTGAASGIGRATARTAARSGLSVSCWDIDTEGLAETLRLISADGGSAQAVECDVTDPDAVARAWDAALASGPVPYLVNNAGPPSWAELSLSEGLAIGAGSMASVTEEWLARVGDDAAAVVFLASVNGTVRAGGTQDWYPAGKAAISAYMRQVAVSRGGRPRANAVAPGLTDTPRTAGIQETEFGQQMIRRNPLGRIARADEMAAVICFLLSPAASYVNAVTIAVDGGGSWSG